MVATKLCAEPGYRRERYEEAMRMLCVGGTVSTVRGPSQDYIRGRQIEDQSESFTLQNNTKIAVLSRIGIRTIPDQERGQLAHAILPKVRSKGFEFCRSTGNQLRA